jgi:wyosine [tRNA(Phe)-imidazoG37] synthetase (radical SAM superfamily)
MRYLQLFESYTEDEYRKVLSNVKTMVQNDRKKEDILTFISKYYSDNAKHLDKIRIIVNRIIKEYASYKRMIHIGEIRKVSMQDKRIKDAKRLGYKDIADSNSFKYLSEAIKSYLK